MNNEKIQKVIKEYFNISKVINIKRFGNGLINETYLIEFMETKYIIQKINSFVFQSPIGVMYNIELITNFIKDRIIYEGGNYLNSTLTLVQSIHKKNFVIVDDEYWRCYTLICGTTFDESTDPNIIYEAGLAVGNFQHLLKGFYAKLLSENIKNFHNTFKRYEDFINAVKIDKYERVKFAKEEINFVDKYKSLYSIIVDALNNESIPLRVVHNDTKLNNILFSNNKSLCLIDLDTTMPGSIVYDYGDALRSCISLSKEDETELDKVNIDIHLFYAFNEGFFDSMRNDIEESEVDLLFYGYLLMTLELGMRFLTDFISGDQYFKLSESQIIKRPFLNLERARNQFKLAKEIENNKECLIRIIYDLYKKGEKHEENNQSSYTCCRKRNKVFTDNKNN